MSRRGFTEQLRQVKRLALDLGPFQVYLQGLAQYEGLSLALFEHIEQGRAQAVTSALTLSELLVEPYEAKDDALVQEYNYLLPTFPNLTLAPVTLAIADRAASYRVRHGMSLLSGIQAATAVLEGADIIVTTDPGMRRLEGELGVLLLKDYL